MLSIETYTAMHASWAISLGGDAPVLVVPWQDESGRVAYVDLRSHPERVNELPEAREYPFFCTVLARLNAPNSRWATAKCDRWTMDEDDLDAASFDLAMARDKNAGLAGIGSYIDFYSRDVAQFISLEHHRELLKHLTRAAEGFAGEGVRRDGHPTAMLELTLRRCIAEGREGHAMTAFVYAIGTDAAQAETNWAAALETMTHILLQ